MRYTVTDLDEIANDAHLYLFEFWDKMVVVGYIVKKDGMFQIANLGQTCTWNIRPSHLNRIISTFSFKIYKSKTFKTIDIFEFNDLVNKANCEII